MQIKTKLFDKISISNDGKTVISMRDGYQEYLGAEISADLNQDKLYKVYRKKNEVKKAARLLDGIPITNDHISMDGDISEDEKIGQIISTEVVDADNSEFNSTIFVKNSITLQKKREHNELSLGYDLKLIDSEIDGMDFEQIDIKPHHLAFVERGRCGKACKILDKVGEIKMTEAEMKKKISDMQEEHIKKMDEMQEKLSDMEKKNEDMATELSEKDNEISEKDNEEKIEKAEDAAIKAFKGSKTFLDDVAIGAKCRAAIIEKAKSFLDKDYDYLAKTNEQIMKDAVVSENKEIKLEDAEYKTAFKLLKAKSRQTLIDEKAGDGEDGYNDQIDKVFLNEGDE